MLRRSAALGLRPSSGVTLLLILRGLAWTRLPDKHVWQVAAHSADPAAARHLGARVAGRHHARARRRRRQARQAGLGRCHSAGLDRHGLGLLGVARLVRRPDSAVGRLSELAGLGLTRAPRLFTYDHIQRWLTMPSGYCAGSWCRPRSFPMQWHRRSGAGVCPCGGFCASCGTGAGGWRWCWRRCSAWCCQATSLPECPRNGTAQVGVVVLKLAAAYLLAVVSWVLLLAWAAVLFARTQSGAKPPDDSLVPASAQSGPLGEDSARLPLPESGGDSSGNA